MKIKSIYLYAIFIILLSLTVMLSHDDFFWGTSAGYDLLKTNFSGYNGRYLGNTIIILMTRSVIFRVIIYTLTSVSIPILIAKLLAHKIKMRYIIILLMTIPISIFRQTFGWFSGFANYNISTALLLLIFYLILKKQTSVPTVILLFVVSVCSQLFLENVSVVNLILSGAACLFALIYERKKLFLSVTWFLGSLAGLLVMFGNDAYTSDTSRSLSNTHFTDIYSHLLQDWSELLIKDNVLMLILFSIFIYLILQMPKKLGLFLLFFNIYFSIRKYLHITFYNQNIISLNIELILIIIFAIILFSVGFIALQKEERFIYIASLIGAVFYVAPFLITTPFGPRNILTSYILFVVALSVLFINLPAFNYAKQLGTGVKYAIVFLSIFTISLYTVNKVHHKKRIVAFAKTTSAKDGVYQMVKSPYPFLGQWLDNFEDPTRLKEMKEYYGITNDLKVKLIDRRKVMEWQQDNN